MREKEDRFFSLMLLLFWVLPLMGGEKGSVDSLQVSTNFKHLIQLHNPIEVASNPAALILFPVHNLRQIKAQSAFENGAFKRVMEGDKINTHSLFAEGYKKIKRTFFYGAFQYQNGTEFGMDYSNLFNAYRDTPYLFTDTIGGDNYSREQFSFKSTLSHQISPRFSVGATFNYTVGVGAQNRDPRALNTVMDYQTQLGFIYSLNSSFKLGLNLGYDVFNEEIDISITEKNKAYFIFSQKGLGAFSKHEASSFGRKYDERKKHLGLQLQHKRSALELRFFNALDKVDDGRMNGNKSWASINNDAEYRGNKVSGKYSFTLKNKGQIQQFTLGASYKKSIGKEVLQDLVLVDSELNSYQWKTLSKDDKYEKSITKLQLNYTLTQLASLLFERYALGLSVGYKDYSETYYLPSQKLASAHVFTKMHLRKTIELKENSSNIQAEFSMAYSKNTSNRFALERENFLTDKILIPDFYYSLADIAEVNVSGAYRFKLKHRDSYLKVNYKLQMAQGNRLKQSTRNHVAFSIGSFF